MTFSKSISIIPAFDTVSMFFQTGILKHLPHLGFCESKTIAVFSLRDRIGDKIICPGKYTFFGNPQTSCYHCKIQKFIGLQSFSCKTPYQIQHMQIITILICIGQWNIIFIHYQNYRFPIMHFHHSQYCIK